MKLSNVVLLGTLGLMGVTASTSAVSADETQTYKSHGIISYTKNSGSTDPGIVDPGQPGTVDPTDPSVDPGTGGPLSIDYVSNFNFGSRKISGNKATYDAHLVEVTAAADSDAHKAGEVYKVPNYLQVSDNRGSVSGWKLTVAQTKAFTSEDGSSAIKGAQMTLTNQNTRNADDDASKKGPTDLNKTVVIGDGTKDEAVMTAADGEGAGTWTDAFGNVQKQSDQDVHDSVKLEVPGGQKLVDQKYSSDITWTLTDAGI
ncbi:WxL domain-containing protein [Dellaglioa sp. L3N]